MTVVTNSLRVADVLYRSGRRDQTVILTGGSDAVRGARRLVRRRPAPAVHLDLVFIGVQDKPALFSTVLMWVLAELFEQLPEVGDLPSRSSSSSSMRHTLFDGRDEIISRFGLRGRCA